MMEHTEDEQPTESVDWRRYWAVAQRRRWLFLIPLFLGWLSVWTFSWHLPSVYRSGTLILVEQPAVPQQFVVPNIGGDLQDRLQSITQQILSRTRLVHIIESLNLYAEERKQHTTDELVERMRTNIQIELVHSPEHDELTAFNVYFSSENPRTAQQVTTQLTELFISENLAVRQQQSENTTQFLESQLEQAKQDLSQQEQKIREFKDQHLGDLPGQLQSNLQILAGLQSQLGAEQDALNRAKQQSVYLGSLLGQYREVQRQTGTGNAPVGLPLLDQELDRLRAQLADLSSHYTDRHPDVRKLKQQIATAEKLKGQIKQDLAAQTSQSQEDPATSSRTPEEAKETSATIELESQLKVNRLEISNRERAIQGLHSRIDDYQARLNREPIREQQLADLTRGYDQSRANYDSLLRKKNDSELATNLERRQQGEQFRVLDPPSLPTKPYSPNRLKLCGIGLFVGLLLGGGLSAGAEVLSDILHTEKELVALVPVKILSEIPHIPSLAEEHTKRTRAVMGWVATGLIFACIMAGTAVSYLRG